MKKITMSNLGKAYMKSFKKEKKVADKTPRYYKLREYNEWERETWTYYIPVNGNKENK